MEWSEVKDKKDNIKYVYADNFATIVSKLGKIDEPLKYKKLGKRASVSLEKRLGDNLEHAKRSYTYEINN